MITTIACFYILAGIIWAVIVSGMHDEYGNNMYDQCVMELERRGNPFTKTEAKVAWLVGFSWLVILWPYHVILALFEK